MPNRKQCHTHAPKGAKVIIRLKDGSMFIDKFIKNEKGSIYLQDRTVKIKDVQMMSIYKNQQERDKTTDLIATEAIGEIGKYQKLTKAQKKDLRTQIKKQI